MTKLKTIIILFALLSLPAYPGLPGTFADYFTDQAMRIDYFHLGDKNQEFITIDRIYKQGTWGGNPHALIDNFDNGRYYIKVYDTLDKNLIFLKGFDSYFAEYKTTDQAAHGIKRTYHETALIPFPKHKIRFVIETRERSNRLNPIFESIIDPAAIDIITGSPISGVKVFEFLKNGPPQRKVDLAFIAEGYTASEEKLFKKLLEKILENFFQQEPYRSDKDKFNVYGVFKASQESGCDEPRHGIYRNTALDSSFDSLGLSRYLLTEGNKALRDIAAHVPYDALLIMVNSKRYGGGGIYNNYCVFTAESTEQQYLLIHEFGHSFAGLADEYYGSSVAYNEFYPPGIEPLEPNITALLEPANLKWKNLVDKDVAIPTKWDKELYEDFSMKYQKTRQEFDRQIADLERKGAPQAEIDKLKEQAELLKTKNSRKTDAFLQGSPLYGKVGAFEGAGYTARGLYRPMLDCIMFTVGVKPYCKVCAAAVSRVINHYTRSTRENRAIDRSR